MPVKVKWNKIKSVLKHDSEIIEECSQAKIRGQIVWSIMHGSLVLVERTSEHHASTTKSTNVYVYIKVTTVYANNYYVIANLQ